MCANMLQNVTLLVLFISQMMEYYTQLYLQTVNPVNAHWHSGNNQVIRTGKYVKVTRCANCKCLFCHKQVYSTASLNVTHRVYVECYMTKLVNWSQYIHLLEKSVLTVYISAISMGF